MRRIQCWANYGIVPLVMLAGCSQAGPNLATVSGRVSLDGEPLVGAMVMFQPEEKGSPSYGATDQDGRYALGYNRTRQGAMIGRHSVRIQVDEVIMGPNGQPIKREKLVPLRYNSNSELRCDVKSGDNVIDFDLTSSAK